MPLSVFDLFAVGIGPSSSHTVGPMRAAAQFINHLTEHGLLHAVHRLHIALHGSLGATGTGHGTIGAVVLGLMGANPETIEPATVQPHIQQVRTTTKLTLPEGPTITFDIDSDITLSLQRLDFHSNGMIFHAYANDNSVLAREVYFSIGGGAIVNENDTATPSSENITVPHPFSTAAELIALAEKHGGIATVVAENERALNHHRDLNTDVLKIWEAMQQCVTAGLTHRGVLPGKLGVTRRAAQLAAQLAAQPDDPLHVLDWVMVYALAVNEENAAGGRVVTAPTNGAAGIIPAVLHYYTQFIPGANDDGVVRFLLTAAAIGMLFKTNASISGAEVGCQGEVGSACSMAAAGLTAVLGGDARRIENAAEIGIEHNLGLTCDPVGGLVQIPCIERNAIAAVKAITAARMAMRGDGTHFVSLDTAIKTMRDTGADMADKYKETALGGLALNVVEC